MALDHLVAVEQITARAIALPVAVSARPDHEPD
jgi:hypothetical protein